MNGSNGWRPPIDGGGVDTCGGVTIDAFDTGVDTFDAELMDKLILFLRFSFVERFNISV